MRTLDAIVNLRLASLRAARLLGDTTVARAALRADWKVALTRAREEGVLEMLPASPARVDGLAAAFLIRPHPSPYFGGRKLDLLIRGRDRRARAWIRERLTAHAHALRGDVSVHLDRRDAALLPDLERLGIHVNAIALAGDPKRALRRLRETYGELEWDGVDCRPLQTRRQVTAIAALMREEFTRNPQYGAFVPSRRFLSAHSAELRGEIDRASGNHWVLVRGSRLVGHFGFPYFRRSSFGRPIAAFGVTLHRDWQGKGLAKVAYRTMLERMVELDVRLLLGMTSQPPVIRLSTVMGRWLIGYDLRAGPAWFPREHFRYPLIDTGPSKRGGATTPTTVGPGRARAPRCEACVRSRRDGARSDRT